jgi:beta-lactamase regulating signal transducer with metallopeptidase domain
MIQTALETLQRWPVHFLAPETVRLIALALLHFLWQGAALAAIAYGAMTICRTASARYVVGVIALALMLAAPGFTFSILAARQDFAAPDGGALHCCPPIGQAQTISSAAQRVASSALTNFAAKARRLTENNSTRSDYLLWLVQIWFAGVLFLSLRSAVGFLLLERLRGRSCSTVPDDLLELCLNLQDRLRLTRLVRYCKCLHLDAPAVAGWLRPVVLLPASAISGLTTTQLEAVIAHELAHIRRYDAFVNLFQIAVETLLFYHPAVWWLGKHIRAERENCCDDVGVAICGSAAAYAHALAQLANSRTAPALAMAANRGPLAARVARLLDVGSAPRSLRSTSLSAAAICFSSALLAGTALVAIARTVHAASQDPTPAPARPASVDKDGAFVVRPSRPPKAALAPAPAPSASAQPTLAPAAPTEPNPWPALATAAPPQAPALQSQTPGTPATGKSSYIDGMKAAGYDNLSVDELIALKIQGVTPEYVKGMRDLGLHPRADDLIGMKVQGITPDYVREMRAATNSKLDIDKLIGLKVQGVTPDYIKQMHDLGLSTDADDIIGLKVQGVTPDYIKQMKDLGLRSDADNIIGMKVQGVTPDYVKNMRSLGLKIDGDDVIGLKVQGVTPEYIKNINDAGLHPDTDELIGMKVQGVTAEYLKAMQAAGLKLDVDDAISAKVQGITPEFVQKVRSHGFKNLTLDQLMELKHSGVLDPEER